MNYDELSSYFSLILSFKSGCETNIFSCYLPATMKKCQMNPMSDR